MRVKLRSSSIRATLRRSVVACIVVHGDLHGNSCRGCWGAPVHAPEMWFLLFLSFLQWCILSFGKEVEGHSGDCHHRWWMCGSQLGISPGQKWHEGCGVTGEVWPDSWIHLACCTSNKVHFLYGSMIVCGQTVCSHQHIVTLPALTHLRSLTLFSLTNYHLLSEQ